MAVAQIPRNVIDPTIHVPEPIAPNLMQNVVTWIRDPQIPLLAKIGMAALCAFAALAAGAIFGQTLLSLSLTTTASVLWGIREYSLQSEAEEYSAGREIRSLQQRLSFAKVRNLFAGFDELPVLEDVDAEELELEDLDDPISKGTDRYGRPFVAMKIRGDFGGEDILVLLQRYTTGGEWTSYLGQYQDQEFLNDRLGDEDFAQVRRILEGDHPTYALADQHQFNLDW